MLDFEICKKLKEAGFPQDAHYGDTFVRSMQKFVMVDEETQKKVCIDYHWRIEESFDNFNNTIIPDQVSDGVKCPTLSELIAAFGDDFLLLQLYAGAGDKWGAGGMHCLEGRGNTPEKAVANLWLSLNKLK